MVNSLWPSDTIWVNIDSDKGLLPEGTKPLPESMLTFHNFKSSDINMRTILQEMSSIIKIHL